jgi:hypothetical protein
MGASGIMSTKAQKPGETKERKVAFEACMKILASTFRRDFDPAAMSGYWCAFRDVDPAKIRSAFEEAICRELSSFPPSPGRIRSFVEQNKPPQPKAENYTPPTPKEWKEIHAGIEELRQRIATNVTAETEAARTFALRWGRREL